MLRLGLLFLGRLGFIEYFLGVVNKAQLFEPDAYVLELWLLASSIIRGISHLLSSRQRARKVRN